MFETDIDRVKCFTDARNLYRQQYFQNMVRPTVSLIMNGWIIGRPESDLSDQAGLVMF